MSNIWFPLPVTLFLRRVVNVLSTLSITHHYLFPLPPRSTGADSENNGQDDPSHSSPWAGRVLQSLNRLGPQEAERHVLPLQNSLLDHILQAFSFHWPTQLSFFHPSSGSRSNGYVEQLSSSTKTDGERISPYSDTNPGPGPPEPPEPMDRAREERHNVDEIHRLLQNPVLYNPLRAPRYPIVLCHGLYGFDVRGPTSFPSLRMHYWLSILGILRKTVGAEVIVTAVPRTGSIASRAEQLDRFLQIKAFGRGINFMAHSMGGLDCRHLITHLKPADYTPLSLTTIATPHRGSPFMDWCQEHLGLGRRRLEEEEKSESISASAVTAESVVAAAKAEASHFASARSSSTFLLSSLPSSFSTFILGMFDSPAYANLTTRYLTKIFNPRTPDDPRVRYFSVAGRTGPLNIWHPLWLPKVVLDGTNGREGNDGLVSVESARWGEFLGTLEGADHWALRGASGIEFLDTDLASVVGSRDAWGLADWGRFVRALGRIEERGRAEGVQQAQGTSASLGREDRALSPTSPSPSSSSSPSPSPPSPSSSSSDEGLRRSTERLSAVFDWLVEQVPIASRNKLSFAGDGNSKSSGGGCGAGGGAGGKKREDATSWGKKEGYGDADGKRGDLESKRDLERLYVALARKLYDEGL